MRPLRPFPIAPKRFLQANERFPTFSLPVNHRKNNSCLLESATAAIAILFVRGIHYILGLTFKHQPIIEQKRGEVICQNY